MKKLNKKQKELLKQRLLKVVHIICYICTGLFLLLTIIGGVVACDNHKQEAKADNNQLVIATTPQPNLLEYEDYMHSMSEGLYFIRFSDIARSNHEHIYIDFLPNSHYELYIFPYDGYPIITEEGILHFNGQLVYDYTLNSIGGISLAASSDSYLIYDYVNDLTISDSTARTQYDCILIHVYTRVNYSTYNNENPRDIPNSIYLERHSSEIITETNVLETIFRIFGWCFGVAYGTMVFEIAPGLTLASIFLFPIIIGCLIFCINALKGL